MRRFVTLLGLLLLASVASAQTVLNPTTVTFTPSADHNATVGGVALVTKYELRHYLVGAPSPVQTQDLGKPTPVSGSISAAITSLPFSPTNEYIAKVAAVGPTGVGESAASNHYFFAGPPATPASVSVSK